MTNLVGIAFKINAEGVENIAVHVLITCWSRTKAQWLVEGVVELVVVVVVVVHWEFFNH